jgi:hypothetical protein
MHNPQETKKGYRLFVGSSETTRGTTFKLSYPSTLKKTNLSRGPLEGFKEGF